MYIPSLAASASCPVQASISKRPPCWPVCSPPTFFHHPNKDPRFKREGGGHNLPNCHPPILTGGGQAQVYSLLCSGRQQIAQGCWVRPAGPASSAWLHWWAFIKMTRWILAHQSAQRLSVWSAALAPAPKRTSEVRGCLFFQEKKT